MYSLPKLGTHIDPQAVSEVNPPKENIRAHHLLDLVNKYVAASTTCSFKLGQDRVRSIILRFDDEEPAKE